MLSFVYYYININFTILSYSPALLELFAHDALGNHTVIIGYARTKIEHNEFIAMMKKNLIHLADEDVLDRFLNICHYQHGPYDSPDAFRAVCDKAHQKLHGLPIDGNVMENRLFYFALPPKIFMDVAYMIHGVGMSRNGFNRLVLEKPFGRDTNSALKLEQDLGKLFSENELYRIDHYLGKEMVQNVVTLRFANSFLEPIWNRNYVASVTISFKEDIGTQGRGGYFDKYGIIRDVVRLFCCCCNIFSYGLINRCKIISCKCYV